jgi:hypothetical protein
MSVPMTGLAIVRKWPKCRDTHGLPRRARQRGRHRWSPCEPLEARQLLSATPALNLLFFGDSFTNNSSNDGSAYDMPATLKSIAVADGFASPNVYEQILLGETLADHLNKIAADGSSDIVISSLPAGQHWNDVVLQEYSTRPTDGTALEGNVPLFRTDALQLFNDIRANSPLVQGILYETWARGTLNNDYPTYFAGPTDMQNQLQTNYNLAAEDINAADGAGSAAVSPVGEAWRALNWEASLYSTSPGDGVEYHPSAEGVLLNAMVNFDTIYHAKVSTIPIGNVSGILASLGLTSSDWTTLAAVADAATLAAAQPTIGSVTASPTSVVAGNWFLLSANKVTDTTANISRVAFYRKNGSGSATLVGTGAQNGSTWAMNVSTRGLAAGSYTYYAVATDSDGVSTSMTTSPTVNVNITTPVSSLGAFTSDLDIGSPGHTGSASYNASASTYTVSGGGSDIWNTADQFNFASQAFSGNGSIVARVASITNTNAWAKAGVMFRTSSNANSAFADVVATAGEGVSFQWRSSAGAQCGYSQVIGITAPVWVKLTRTGNSFAGFYSTNGTTWIQIGFAQVVTMGTTALAGLAVTAHNNSVLNTATFTNVAV